MDFTSTDVLGQRVEFLSPQNSTLANERDNSYDRFFDDPLKVETLNQRKSFIDTQENIPSCSESLIGICPIDHTNASNMIGCRSDVVVTNDYASLKSGGQDEETSMITDVSLPTESTKQDTWNSNGICNTRNTSIMDNSSLTVSGGRTYHSLETPESNNVVFKCIVFMLCNSKHKIIFVQFKPHINFLTKFLVVCNSRCCLSFIQL